MLQYWGEIGWLLPKYRYYKSCLRLWNRIVKMDNNCLTKCIFESDLQSFSAKSWSMCIYNIFSQLNMTEYFHNLEEVNVKCMDDYLFDLMHNYWCSEVATKPKLRTFTLIKENVIKSKYVTLPGPKYKRAIVAQLRIGILPLEIETGRYYRTPIQNRICKLCNEAVEDEIHFACVCPSFIEIRNKYSFSINFNHNCPLDIYIEMMNNENQRKVTNFINEIWEKRQSLINV